MIRLGDRVIWQGEHWGNPVSVTGVVVEEYGNTVVIEDDHAETEDDRLEFKRSELKLLSEVRSCG